MRGAIIGFGTIAQGHVVGYEQVDDLAVVAAVDVSPERRAVAAQEFGLRAYASVGELLAHEAPDFIDVCSPPHTHVEYVRLGLSNDVHVLCEKPVFVPSDGGYDELVRDILASDRIVYPSHNYKFAPILGIMQHIVSAPSFGRVLNVQFRTLRTGHARGVTSWQPQWRREPHISMGGILRDHGPHSVYLATNITPCTPRAVSCILGNLRPDEYASTEDTAILTIRCEEDLEIGMTLSWAAGYRNSYYAVMGSKGNVVVENDDVRYTRDGEVITDALDSGFDDPSHADWFERMFRDFVDTVRHPERQAPLIREALMTSIVIDAAYASAADGGRWVDVVVPELLEENPAV